MARFELCFDLPDGIRLVSITRRWDEKWAVCIRVDDKILDSWGKSLGTVYGYKEADTFQDALSGALLKMRGEIAARAEAGPTVPTAANLPFPRKGEPEREAQSVDELANELGF